MAGDVDAVEQPVFLASGAVYEKLAEGPPAPIHDMTSAGVEIAHHLRSPCLAELLPEDSLGEIV